MQRVLKMIVNNNFNWLRKTTWKIKWKVNTENFTATWIRYINIGEKNQLCQECSQAWSLHIMLVRVRNRSHAFTLTYSLCFSFVWFIFFSIWLRFFVDYAKSCCRFLFIGRLSLSLSPLASRTPIFFQFFRPFSYIYLFLMFCFYYHFPCFLQHDFVFCIVFQFVFRVSDALRRISFIQLKSFVMIYAPPTHCTVE